MVGVGSSCSCVGGSLIIIYEIIYDNEMKLTVQRPTAGNKIRASSTYNKHQIVFLQIE